MAAVTARAIWATALRPIDDALRSARGVVMSFAVPDVRVSRVPLHSGGLLVFATDGIASGYLESIAGADPQQIADDMLARFGTRFDDAPALVALYEGGA